jgi:hypothetical protein
MGRRESDGDSRPGQADHKEDDDVKAYPDVLSLASSGGPNRKTMKRGVQQDESQEPDHSRRRAEWESKKDCSHRRNRRPSAQRFARFDRYRIEFNPQSVRDF